jgi:hypothetical protein
MTLDNGDKAIIDLRCEKIAEKIIERVLEKHVNSCIHGKTIFKTKFLLFGICIGCGFAIGDHLIPLIKLFFG